jgi:TolB protein
MLATAVAAIALLLLAAPAQATFPGQNGKLAFGSCGPEDCGIFVSAADGSDAVQITHNPEFIVVGGTIHMEDGYPAWSADGSKIAYARTHANGETEVRIVNADGSGDRSLIAGTQPAWSPDGSRIAFAKGPGKSVAAVNSDGSDPVNLPTGIASQPDWSPDGRQIAFAASLGGTDEIVVMNLDGSGRTLITFGSPGTGSSDPSWSPEGSRIVFERGNDPAELFAANADGTGLVQLTENSPVPPDFLEIGDDEGPGWSPDGSLIVFSRIRGAGILHTIRPDGTGLANLGVGGTTPAWQPLPGPRRADYKNRSKFCKALRDFLGGEQFARQYGSHGKCVSRGS